MRSRQRRIENKLARRHLRVFGPTTADAFAEWAGIKRLEARAAFEALAPSLTAVRTPFGDAWIQDEDEPVLRADPQPPAAARLLPSGDTFWLLQGADRELLRNLAVWGKGRNYEVDDPREVPQVFVKETEQSARPAIARSIAGNMSRGSPSSPRVPWMRSSW